MAVLEHLRNRPVEGGDTDAVIRVQGLCKSYGELEAVRGIDLTVLPGETFAFIGPNAAGKTTTVEMLEGYRRRTAGVVEVLGEDPASPSPEWKARIGIVLQTSRMPPELTVRELVSRHAKYFPTPRHIDETIELVGLHDKRDARAGKLSGGQQRRLDVALALIGDPELLFLDEPTTGFDPAARRKAWSMIEDLRSLGKTVFLTTHFMDEAEALADRVAVIVGGAIVAEGTPETLGGRDKAPCEIRFRPPRGMDPALTRGARIEGGIASITTPDPVEMLGPVLDWARFHGVELAELEVRRPSLEDIYLELTKELT
jgi:ABC-2 type transport system ATP-binding protein